MAITAGDEWIRVFCVLPWNSTTLRILVTDGQKEERFRFRIHNTENVLIE